MDSSLHLQQNHERRVTCVVLKRVKQCHVSQPDDDLIANLDIIIISSSGSISIITFYSATIYLALRLNSRL